MEHIRASKDVEWAWISSQPKFIIDFIYNGEVLGALFQRTNKMSFVYSVLKERVHSVLNDEILELEKTTILHKLSQCPLNDDQMTTILSRQAKSIQVPKMPMGTPFWNYHRLWINYQEGSTLLMILG